jgi:hypothetical protein
MLTSIAPNNTCNENTDALNINNIHSAISYSLSDPEIKKLIEPFGYSERSLLDGKKLYESVRNMQNVMNTAQRWRHKSEERLHVAKAAAYKAFHDLQEVERTASGAFTSSGISGGDIESLSISVFLTRAYTVLKSIESNAKSTRPNYDPDKWKSDRSEFVMLDNTEQIADAAKTSVKKATAELAEATKALESWFIKYSSIANKALRGNKELLDKLGLITDVEPDRSSKPQVCISKNDNNS